MDSTTKRTLIVTAVSILFLGILLFMLINKYMTPQVPLNIKRARFYSQNSKYAEAIAQYQKSIIQPGDREEKIIAFNE